MSEGRDTKLALSVRGWSRLLVATFALVSLVCIVAIGIDLFTPRQSRTVRPRPAASAAVWKPIAERVEEAEQGRFPLSEGTLTFSASAAAADEEIRSVVGTYPLPAYGAAELESGESWGVSGLNHDEFMMYVHNFLDRPVSAMLLRISDGTCASFSTATTVRWASAYWAEDLGADKEAVFHAALPAPYNLASYCAVITKIYAAKRS